MRLARLAVLALLVLPLLACGEDSTTAPVSPVFYPLGEGTWHMHTANDSTLSATIGDRFIGIVRERTVLDSAMLSVNLAGVYEQRYYVRVYHGDALDRSDIVYDYGTWTKQASVYAFASAIRERQFTVTMPERTRLMTDEPMLFFPDAEPVIGSYRTTRP